jgi:hypothetical protein
VLIRMCSECERKTVVTGRRLCADCAERLDADLAMLLLVPRQVCPEDSPRCTCAPLDRG